MIRAAVLIGVNTTGGLPSLADAVNGAKAMAAWAREQGIDQDNVVLVTDEDGPVTAQRIKEPIRRLLNVDGLDQLLVYFAGHGINKGNREYWLLSDAPTDSQAAVNVASSVEFAQHGVVPHVIFISDACRTAAEGTQAQAITGCEIFPNDAVEGPEKHVDVYFATCLGSPSFEIRDPAEAAAGYRAIYTSTMLDALIGQLPRALESTVEAGEIVSLVRLRPLRDVLKAEVPRRIAAMKLKSKKSQVPDARVNSDPDAWIARLPFGPIALGSAPGLGAGEEVVGRGHAAIEKSLRDTPAGSRPAGTGGSARSGSGRSEPSLNSFASKFLASALSGTPLDLVKQSAMAKRVANPVADALVEGARRALEEFGPLHFESQCGFKLRGGAIVRVSCERAHVEMLDASRTIARVSQLQRPAANVLIEFENGSSALVPAIPEFITELTLETGLLTDVVYEPSDNTGRWREYVQHRAELRTLRGAIATAGHHGLFRLEGKDALKLASRMQYAKGLDPTLSIFAANAYYELQQSKRLREMAGYQRDDLGFNFFDVAMLSKVATSRANVFPGFPMLAQGWALLSSLGNDVPDEIIQLGNHLTPALWTQFDPAGTALLRNYLHMPEAT